MLGRANRIARDEPGLTPTAADNIPADLIAALELYHRSRNNRDAIGAEFIVIDAGTDAPIVYTGSASVSGNSVFRNDENLLEIKGSARLAQLYLAEFLRLYEHYRARARFIEWKRSGQAPQDAGSALRPNRGWADRHYTAGAPEYKARVRMLSVT